MPSVTKIVNHFRKKQCESSLKFNKKYKWILDELNFKNRVYVNIPEKKAQSYIEKKLCGEFCVASQSRKKGSNLIIIRNSIVNKSLEINNHPQKILFINCRV